MNNVAGEVLSVLMLMGGGFILIGFLVSAIRWLGVFQQELKYLNMEIRRTEGEEQRHYIREKRRLIRSLLPFFRG